MEGKGEYVCLLFLWLRVPLDQWRRGGGWEGGERKKEQELSWGQSASQTSSGIPHVTAVRGLSTYLIVTWDLENIHSILQEKKNVRTQSSWVPIRQNLMELQSHCLWEERVSPWQHSAAASSAWTGGTEPPTVNETTREFHCFKRHIDGSSIQLFTKCNISPCLLTAVNDDSV